MFLSRIITSRYIAVKWYLRVYWLLPLSIVDSFKKHRRFFRRAPTILLLSTDDSFSSHRGCLEKSIYFISKRSHFLLSPDSFSLHQLNQQTAWQKSYWINRHLPTRPSGLFVDKTVISDMLNSGDLLGRAKICACSLGGRASMRRSLSFDWHPARKETTAGFILPVTSRPTIKSTDPQ